MGSIAGAGGSGKSSSAPTALTLNPATLILGSALGLPSRVTEKGGLTFSRKGANTGFPQGSIDPSQAFAPLANLFNPRGGNVITGTGIPAMFGQQGLFGAGQAMNLFNNSLMPAANELVSTGFKTDINPAIAQAQSRFRNDFLPDAIEQFGLLGLDAGDSDFGSAVAREAGRISTELGALDVGLSESAAQRRMGGIPLAGEVAMGAAGLPLTLANDLFSFEQSTRAAEFNASPEGQIFNLLAALSGLDTQMGLGQVSSSRNASGSGSVSAEPKG